MNTYRFTRRLDQTLALAAASLRLAHDIQSSLNEVLPCPAPNLLWRW
ncbi:MAG TPA: hypothetical protein VHM90_20920 [Phycisphaerae bacterium]|nr:hypothetical protein [Phycisphaerae bacterium]